MRFRLPVGVAYGSDLERVRTVLVEAALANPSVLRDPAPEVFSSAFGESSLNLELVVWALEVAPLRFCSSLNFAIDAALCRHGIEVPFPQRDVRIRSTASEP